MRVDSFTHMMNEEGITVRIVNSDYDLQAIQNSGTDDSDEDCRETP